MRTGDVEIEESRRALFEGIARKCPLLELSKLYVAYVLAEHRGNKVHASRALQMDRRTIQRWERPDANAPGGRVYGAVRTRTPPPVERG